MTVDKDFVPRTFRIDRLVRSAAITVALTATCLLPIVAQAQTTEPAVGGSTTTITTTTTTTAAPVAIPTVSDITAGAPPNIDYTILGAPGFDYAQIRRAQAYGMTDAQIGRVIGIADKAGVPPAEILNRVRDGWTFQMIADYYGTPASYTDPAYAQKVEDYLTAYQATGRGAIEMANNYGSSMSSTGTLNGGVPASMQSTDILQTLRSSGDFDTFVRALHRARLNSTLNGAGPYTVFAPTDEAFSKLPPDQLKELMRDRSELRQVLQYHVIPARISAADAMSMSSPTSPPTLEGDTLNVTTSNGQVMVNNATVTTPDIQASNGVIHAIDTVLVPSSVNLMATPGSSATPPAAPASPAVPADQGMNSNSPTNPTPGAMSPAPLTITPPAQPNSTPMAPAPAVPNNSAPTGTTTTPTVPAPSATTPDQGPVNNAVPNANPATGAPSSTPTATPDQGTVTTTPDNGTTGTTTAPSSTTDNGAMSTGTGNSTTGTGTTTTGAGASTGTAAP